MKTPPIIVTKEALFNWIKEQPNDRKISMDETTSDSPCGCLMVQYGKAIFNREFDSVGASSWWKWEPSTEEIASFEEDVSINDLIDDEFWYDITDFGKAKAHLGL